MHIPISFHLCKCLVRRQCLRVGLAVMTKASSFGEINAQRSPLLAPFDSQQHRLVGSYFNSETSKCRVSGRRVRFSDVRNTSKGFLGASRIEVKRKNMRGINIAFFGLL